MSDDKPSGNLPTELINEKTFYTLGGASAAVLLTCWAINYVAVDVSWLNYKMYRLIGIILSETFAVAIVLQKKDRKKIKWLFAFLNGLLIFVNASGLNIMTSSYIFNRSDSTRINKISYFHFQEFRTDAFQQAGIFPLPRMINWWPDEKLIEQNTKLVEKNRVLDSANYQLKVLLQDNTGNKVPTFNLQTDSLKLLQSQLTDKQKQIDELIASLKKNRNDLQIQLAASLKRQAGLNDSLRFYENKFLSCQQLYSPLLGNYDRLRKDQAECNNQVKLLTGQLKECTGAKASLQNTINALNTEINELKQKLINLKDQKIPNETTLTLTELIRQICKRNGMLIINRQGKKYEMTEDDYLKQQQFYKNMNWSSFCNSFSAWENSKNTIIK